MTIAWAAIAGLAIVAGGGLVILVGLAMTRSDRDLRGFVEFVGSRSDEYH